MTCDEVMARGLVEKFVAGRLSDAEGLEAFEAHLLGCARCQREVRISAAIRAGLAARRVRRSRRASFWQGGAWIGIAAGVAVALTIGTRSHGGALERISAMGPLPAYAGIEVRAPGGAADSIYLRAVDAYTAGHYPLAEQTFRRALAAGADSVPASFFLGALRLNAGGADEAATLFRAVLSHGPSPYSDDARYYLAKALLTLGDGTGALHALGGTARERALADSVTEALRR